MVRSPLSLHWHSTEAHAIHFTRSPWKRANPSIERTAPGKPGRGLDKRDPAR